ncbi:hypothetical protein CAMSH0001_0864 [Campylobacter showae RM3277]|uniref:Uncharacterized protein n=1 Tax=Campylobacter showae RM3277 TaxID=553219 RepID=C6RHN8_9BACT|nr:hypothetical protein CAMSH0001_0864 [Campylobacter showae RM3277]
MGLECGERAFFAWFCFAAAGLFYRPECKMREKNKNHLNSLALNLTPNLQAVQTRSRRIYRAEPTKTSQGSAKFYKPQI